MCTYLSDQNSEEIDISWVFVLNLDDILYLKLTTVSLSNDGYGISYAAILIILRSFHE